MPRRSRTPQELIDDRVRALHAGLDKSGGPDACWPWTRSTRPARKGKKSPQMIGGYGQYGQRIDGKTRTFLVHRLSYEIHHGIELRSEQFVLHTCDNPPCGNPKHLVLGDAQANVDDMVNKGRERWRKERGSNHWMARLTEAEVIAMRAAYAAGGISQDALARKYGVGQWTVSHVVRRLTWRHI